MSDANEPIDTIDLIEVDLRAWVDASAANPTLHRDRMVTEIVLTAIGRSPRLSESLFLKGGALMALGFESVRQTADVDFTAMADPEGFDAAITEDLNQLMPTTAIQLGYLDLVCRVQSVKKMPRAENFADQNFPALLVRIASAIRNTPEVRRLEMGQASRVLDLEVSFKDDVHTSQTLKLKSAGVSLRAFSFHELVAEKIRALLQQPIRNRYRRQDVFDIAFLMQHRTVTQDDLRLIHETLLEKCETRHIEPRSTSFDDPEVRRRAEADWHTLKLEVEDLPEFGPCFEVVRSLYASLPWKEDEQAGAAE